ncbi:drug resistance transporter, EmrB/QacA subfamily [Amycolatopsis pretoriensis]|uniref:Drug resistance transporter, EmrB/QacA subfamily n=1 Tax=Amycolatopsis pretoriensis TaxID=218821 RepID=A0A1H5QBD2_9PSEU|nr:MFS transporter [Amycolatopsis pretoriensis]SEF23366.1 drug resistance transporter, EmrB/QacA subfamily [Amycolatopsis pretoriensis]
MTLAESARPDSVARQADPRRLAALVLLCAANFMVILDAQSVIMGVPVIAADLGLSPVEAQWILSGNLLTFGGLLLLGGRAADLLGRRRLFMAGTALFLVVSLLSALATAGPLLLAARALHGVSAALMAPTALAILTDTFPEGRARNRALAVWSGIAALGATIGLLLGGALLDWFGWQSLFYVNVPVAVLMLVLSPVLLRESRDASAHRTFDVAGAVLSTVALGLLVYVLVEAPERGWTSFSTLGLAVVFLALTAATIVVERRSAAPLLPARLFRSATVLGGNVLTVLVAMLAFGMSVVLSQYSLGVLGYTPIVFGLSQSAMPIASVIGAYAAQAALARRGVRPVAVTALLLLAVGSVLLTGLSPEGSYLTTVLPGLLVFGLGLGIGPVALVAAALTGVTPADAGIASGINVAAFQVGGALGVAVVSTVLASNAAAGPLAGFHAGMYACGGIGAAGVLVAFFLLRGARRGRLTAVPRVH